MSQYTKKPVTIEAVQFHYVEAPSRIVLHGHEVPDWLADAIAAPQGEVGSVWIDYNYSATRSDPLQQRRPILIYTLEGVMSAQPHDWIIRGIKGELYPCADEVFRETYCEAGDVDCEALVDDAGPPSGQFDAVKASIHADPDHAWGWHCNLAVPIMDAIGCTHEQSNEAAAFLMSHLWDYDITTHPHYEGGKSSAQQYAEMRKQAEREEDESVLPQMARRVGSRYTAAFPVEAADGSIIEPGTPFVTVDGRHGAVDCVTAADFENQRTPSGDLSFAGIVDRLDAAKAVRRIKVPPKQEAENYATMPDEPRRTVLPDRVAQTITDPIVRAYVEGMGSMMLDMQGDCIELRARIRKVRKLVHAFLGSEEQREAYNEVMELLKEDSQ